jgi:hypothetical protein
VFSGPAETGNPCNRWWTGLLLEVAQAWNPPVHVRCSADLQNLWPNSRVFRHHTGWAMASLFTDQVSLSLSLFLSLSLSLLTTDQVSLRICESSPFWLIICFKKFWLIILSSVYRLPWSFTGVAPNYLGISFSYTYTKKKICQTPTIWKSETHGDWKINTTERNKLEWTLSLLTTAPPFDFHVQFQNDPGFIIFYLQTTPFLCGYRQELHVNTSNWN